MSVFLPARLLVSFRGRRAPFSGWLGLFVSVLFFGCCRLLSLPVVASLPPAVGPLWRPGPVCTLVPPSGYLVAFVTAWLPCLTAGGVVVLCCPYFMLSHGSKGLWPCVGFVFPLHHDACVVRVLSITTLRYSSVMIQVPHWTPLSYTIAILGSMCGLLRPCPPLPSRRPPSRSCCGCVVVGCSFVPSVSSCNPSCLHLGA